MTPSTHTDTGRIAKLVEDAPFATLGDFWARSASGTCPMCGYYNHPDAETQRGQDTGTLYCLNCGQTWSAR